MLDVGTSLNVRNSSLLINNNKKSSREDNFNDQKMTFRFEFTS